MHVWSEVLAQQCQPVLVLMAIADKDGTRGPIISLYYEALRALGCAALRAKKIEPLVGMRDGLPGLAQLKFLRPVVRIDDFLRGPKRHLVDQQASPVARVLHQICREVNTRSDRREVQHTGAAHRAEDHILGGDTDAEVEELQAYVALGVPARLHGIERRQHRERASDGIQSALVRLAKERHQAISEKLVHDAVV